jgi:hypothetical protein
MNEHSHDFKSVVVLQNCMGLNNNEPYSGTGTCVTALENGTEESNVKVKFNIKVEETLDIKEENFEELTFPKIKPEAEVRVWACV